MPNADMIVLIEGFCSIRGSKRLKVLEGEIKKEFPEATVIVPEYFERYGWASSFWRKTHISDYARRVFSKIVEETGADFMAGFMVNSTLDSFLGKETDGSIILIGYSMGGLVCRSLVERLSFPATAVILVGAPHKGIHYSIFRKLFLKIVRVPCLLQMERGSDFLRRLNESPMSRYYWIGGKRDKIVSIGSAIPEELLENKLKSYKGIEIVDTDHYSLIPVKNEDLKKSAIPAIIKILQKEIKGGK